MVMEQRVGRVDRLGQEKSTINVINFLVNGSIDERVLEVLQRKLQIISDSMFSNEALVETTYKPGVSLIVDKLALDQEIKKGEDLVDAITLSSRMPEKDYAILSHIDERYCDPGVLAQQAESGIKISWLESTEKANE